MKKLLVSILTSLFVASFANAASIGVTYEFASVDGSGTEYVVQDGATPNSNTGTSSKDVDIARTTRTNRRFLRFLPGPRPDFAWTKTWMNIIKPFPTLH